MHLFSNVPQKLVLEAFAENNFRVYEERIFFVSPYRKLSESRQGDQWGASRRRNDLGMKFNWPLIFQYSWEIAEKLKIIIILAP